MLNMNIHFCYELTALFNSITKVSELKIWILKWSLGLGFWSDRFLRSISLKTLCASTECTVNIGNAKMLKNRQKLCTITGKDILPADRNLWPSLQQNRKIKFNENYKENYFLLGKNLYYEMFAMFIIPHTQEKCGYVFLDWTWFINNKISWCF